MIFYKDDIGAVFAYRPQEKIFTVMYFDFQTFVFARVKMTEADQKIFWLPQITQEQYLESVKVNISLFLKYPTKIRKVGNFSGLFDITTTTTTTAGEEEEVKKFLQNLLEKI